MFDLEYNTNVGFIPRFAYLESMAASEEDVADETAAREEAVAALNERIDSIPAFDTEVVDTLRKRGCPGRFISSRRTARRPIVSMCTPTASGRGSARTWTSRVMRASARPRRLTA